MLTPVEIARIEEPRQAVGTAEIAVEAEPIAGGWMAYGGPGSWANQACALGLDGPVTDADLDRLVDFYVDRGAEPRLEVCPFVDPSLLEGLARRGFELREFENVLARPASPGEAVALEHGWPEGLELEEVDPSDEAIVRAFVEVSTSGFRPAERPMSETFYEITARMVRHERCHSYLARVDWEPVGGGAMEVAGRGACLFGTSVLPEHRRRGIQGALIARRCERAGELGAEVVVIHSAPGIPTERNAMRLGFTMAYTKVVMARPVEGVPRSV